MCDSTKNCKYGNAGVTQSLTPYFRRSYQCNLCVFSFNSTYRTAAISRCYRFSY